jgi:FKBP-type peptidyl-prolyl cis-trans isomerase FkpA
MRTRWLAPLVVAVLATVACENKIPEPEGAPRKVPEVKEEKASPKELVKEDQKVGDGPVAEKGDEVKVHYTGRLLKTNLKFDSSVGKPPFSFTLGAGGVIKGWDQGVVGMKVGGKRKLTIPADLGYGAKGSPPKIPPGAALVFDVELLEVVGKGDSAKDDDDAGETKKAADKGDKKPADKGDKKPKKPAAEKKAPKAPAPKPAEKK